jgi:hypothetical protein
MLLAVTRLDATRSQKQERGFVMNSLIIIPIILTLLAGGFWLWMAWDLGGNEGITGNEKFYWQLAFIFMNVFAAVFYYVYVYRKRH